MFNADYMFLVEQCGRLMADAIMEQKYCESVNIGRTGYSEEQYNLASLNDLKYYEAEILKDEELYRMAKKF